MVSSLSVGASSAARLWADNADLARAAVEHPFVRGLADGSLPLRAFQRYIVQDAYFLDSFARAYALALAHCPDSEGLRAFFELLGGVLEELRLHASYLDRWGVADQATVALPATLAYTDFLLATASLGAVGDTCAAMAPCMRLYAHLGTALESTGAAASDNPYAEWVRTYAAPEFEALALKLESLLDRYAHTTARAGELYGRAMSLELAFFNAAWA